MRPFSPSVNASPPARSSRHAHVTRSRPLAALAVASLSLSACLVAAALPAGADTHENDTTSTAAAGAAAASTIYYGVAGDVATAEQRSGEDLAVHSYSDFSRKVEADRMVTLSSGSHTWRQTAAAKPGSAEYADIARWADALKARGTTTLVAFHHEPELDPNRRFGSAADFIAAFRNVSAIFDARKATNVKLVWQMTSWAFRTNSADPEYAAKWYPGDAYVDVVGADTYNWYDCGHGRGKWQPLSTLAGPTVAFAEAHGKQVAFPEYGADADSRRAAWLKDAGAYLESQKSVTAAAFYFNRTPTNGANTDCKWPLTTSDEFSTIGTLAAMPVFAP